MKICQNCAIGENNAFYEIVQLLHYGWKTQQSTKDGKHDFQSPGNLQGIRQDNPNGLTSQELGDKLKPFKYNHKVVIRRLRGINCVHYYSLQV